MANDNTGGWPPRNYDSMGDEHGRGEEKIREEGSYGKPEGMQWTEFENRREEANQDLSQVDRTVEPSIDKGSDIGQEPEPAINNSPEPAVEPEVTEPEKDNNPEPQKEAEVSEPEPEWTQSIGKTSEGRYEDTPEQEQAPEPQKEIEAPEPEPEWTQSVGKTSEGRYEDTPAQEQAPEPQKEVEEKSVEVDHGKDI